MTNHYISTINIKTGAIFNLPTLYADREEAILAGQDYVRNRQLEDGSILFFRVQKNDTGTIPESWNLFEAMMDDDDDEDECNDNCNTCANFLACLSGN